MASISLESLVDAMYEDEGDSVAMWDPSTGIYGNEEARICTAE